jgi:hypothetical protein
MKIYTSYYGNLKKLKAEGIIPISISIGMPKFITEPVLRLTQLAPTYPMLGLEYDEYKEKYLKILDTIDWQSIREILKQTSNGGNPIALCCFESLKGDEEWCHRTMLAEYLNKMIPDVENHITEFVPAEKETIKKVVEIKEQPKLF